MASASAVLAQLSGLIDRVMPGCKRPPPQAIAGNGGFGIAVSDGGQVLVSAGYGEPWFLSFTAGIAQGIRDVHGALEWVNSKNAAFSFGRFYLAGQGDVRAIVYEDRFFSGLLDCAPNLANDWLPQLLKFATEVAAQQPSACIEEVGGQPFGDTDEQRLVLLGASL